MRIRIRHCMFIMLAGLVIAAASPGLPGVNGSAQAASVTCKSASYVTTTFNKSTLKKGKKAKVTVKVTNTTGKTMKDLKVKVVLPKELKKTSGTLARTKASLAKKKSFSFSFYVKAKKKVTFKKKVTTAKTVSGTQTSVVAKNLLKRGKAKKYSTVTFSFKDPADTSDQTVIADPASYAQSMVDLLTAMNTYAKAKNPDFNMISNGGYGLYSPGASTRDSMLAAIDGALIEEVFSDDTTGMLAALDQVMAEEKPAFSIEYYAPNPGGNNVITFDARGNNELNQIPAPAYEKAGPAYDVNKPTDVRDFMAILDPENYKSKQSYLNALKNTDYDLLFIDAFYDTDDNDVQIPLTKADVDSLKTKKNGGKRLVCTYLSVGEAENYRNYWQKSWDSASTRPVWIAEKNPEWEGNYKVRYWYPAWQKILYGSSNAYLDQILAAGFDGVYLDVIDAYEYFANGQ